MIGVWCRIDHDQVVAFTFGPLDLLANAGRIRAAHVGRQIAAAARPLHSGPLRIEIQKKHPLPLGGGLGREMDRERAFADAAFLGNNRYHLHSSRPAPLATM